MKLMETKKASRKNPESLGVTSGDLYGNRTRVTGVRGQRPDR